MKDRPKIPHQYYESVTLSRKNIIINNFLGGIAWAVGTTVGLTIIVALLGFSVRQIGGFIPIIGRFVIQISDFVAANSKLF